MALALLPKKLDGHPHHPGEAGDFFRFLHLSQPFQLEDIDTGDVLLLLILLFLFLDNREDNLELLITLGMSISDVSVEQGVAAQIKFWGVFSLPFILACCGILPLM